MQNNTATAMIHGIITELTAYFKEDGIEKRRMSYRRELGAPGRAATIIGGNMDVNVDCWQPIANFSKD